MYQTVTEIQAMVVYQNERNPNDNSVRMTIAEEDNRHMKQLIGNTILDKLEPEALTSKTINVHDTLLASFAISMKRIADLLEEIEPKA